MSECLRTEGSTGAAASATRRAAARRLLYLPFAVGLVTFAVFSPTLWNSFVDWDDGYLLLANPNWRGLGWKQIHWMFSTALLENYVPVAWLTLGLDYVLWGMRPAGYHLTNVTLHAGNAVLLYLVATRLLGRATRLTGLSLQTGAVTAALSFSLHPLRAESVAWISERRDVLSGLFFLATILFYVDATAATGARRRKLLLVSGCAYVLAIGSKALVMALPLVLLLLDLYPLRRLPLNPRRWLDRSRRGLWLEKLPYLALGIASGATAYLVHHHDGAVKILALPDALGKAAFALWFHFQKTVAPVGLSPMYELPARIDPLAAPFLIAGLGTASVTAATLILARAWPAGLVAWAHHVVVLGPVSGIAQAGLQLTADRYSYLAGPAWGLLAGAGAGVLARLAQRSGRRALLGQIGIGLIALWLLVLGTLSWQQGQVWRTTETLWLAALRESPDCAICHTNFGTWLMRQGRVRAGLEHLRLAATLRPDRPMAFGLVGQAYEQLGMLPEAIAAYREELAARPHMVEARTGLGGALIRAGRPAEAMEELQHALGQEPGFPATLTNLGIALLQLGRTRDAVPHLLAAIAIGPRDGVPRLALARAYLALGEHDRAREQYEVLRELNPALAARLGGRFETGAQPR